MGIQWQNLSGISESREGIWQGTETEIVASNAAGRIWSPTNADESCTKFKYVPGVQEFSNISAYVSEGAVVCGKN